MIWLDAESGRNGIAQERCCPWIHRGSRWPKNVRASSDSVVRSQHEGGKRLLYPMMLQGASDYVEFMMFLRILHVVLG